MDNEETPLEEVFQLSRLALVGREQDVQMFVRRLVRRYRTKSPAFSERLAGLLRDAPTRAAPLRRAGDEVIAPVPVDLDSRLQLLRIEEHPVLDVEPMLDPMTENAVRQLVEERKHLAALDAAGIDPTRSALFVGPPGVGKSLTARWIARELKRPLLTLDLSAVMSSFLGRTGTNIRHVIDYAKSVECVLFLDEFDAIAKRRDDVGEVGELKRLVTVLLQEVDDWPSHGLLIAATNHAELLDPAMWRRFESVIQFGMPTAEQITTAARRFIRDENPGNEHLYRTLGAVFEGTSFSDVHRSIRGAIRTAVMQKGRVEDELTKVVSGRFENLPRADRGRHAASLIELGLTQREVSRITGVSRDTMRKATREKKT